MEFNDFSWVFKSSNIKRLPCSLNMPYVRVCWRTSAYKFLFLMVVTIFHGFQLKKACIFNRVGIRMISSGIYNAQFIFQKKKKNHRNFKHKNENEIANTPAIRRRTCRNTVRVLRLQIVKFFKKKKKLIMLKYIKLYYFLYS